MRYLLIGVKDFFMGIKDSKEIFFEKLIRITIYGGVFLIPLFFIPLSDRFLEFSKVILFYLLIILGVILWLIKIYLTKKINWRIRFLDILLLLFLLVYLFSSIFSVDKYNSFFGGDLSISNSFLTVFFLVLFYFLVSRFINNLKQLKLIFYSLIFVVFIISLIKVLVIWDLNFQFLISAVSINVFYFLLILAFILSGLLYLISEKKIVKISNLVLIVFFLIIIFLIDNQYLLLLLAISIFLFIFLLSFKSNYFSNKLVVALTLLLFLSVLVLILPVSNFTGLISPQQFDLPISFGWQITKSSLSGDLLLGVGPQNFSYSFYKYKPVDLNFTSYWQLGFEKNSNFVLENLNNLGVLGLLFGVIIVFVLYKRLFVYFRQIKILDDFKYKEFLILVGLCVIIASFIIWAFLNNFDFIIIYLFVLFLALTVAFLKKSVPANLLVNKNIINLFVYICLIIVLIFVYSGTRILAAEVYMEKVLVKNYSNLQDFEQAEDYLQRVLKYNPDYYDYNLKLANLLINKNIFLAENEQEYDEISLREKIFENLSLAIQKETKRIDYYIELKQSIDLLSDLGIKALETEEAINKNLIKLDPNNPELYIDRALLNFNKYLLIKANAQDLETEQIQRLLKKVQTDLEKSIELKNDYVLAYYNMGLYWQELGEEEKALSYIEKAYQLDPSQKLIILSLKKLYLNQDKVEQAKAILNRYLEFKPNDEEIRSMLEEL
ncbi:MAG: tetratricopeptide repeat protein [Candidatus Buchananbacteria bacterium]|nr:tetratricopeptide repeat protein [Candidatus Buchananbacteria bacterium]